jgi:DNA-binding response OmpR family regulator
MHADGREPRTEDPELPRRLLIVEDDPDIRGMIPILFAHPQVSITTAHDAGTSLETAARLRPHVVLIDVVLPGRDGVEVFHELRRARPSPRILFMSAAPRPGAAMRASELGAYGFISKPFDESARDVILRALDLQPKS